MAKNMIPEQPNVSLFKLLRWLKSDKSLFDYLLENYSCDDSVFIIDEKGVRSLRPDSDWVCIEHEINKLRSESWIVTNV